MLLNAMHPESSVLGMLRKPIQGDDPDIATAFDLVAGRGEKPITDKSHTLEGAPPKCLEELVDDNKIPGQQIAAYLSPSLEDQTAAGKNLIITGTKIVRDDTFAIEGGTLRSVQLIQEVVDSRYLDFGNLLDLVQELRRGGIPSLDLIILSLADVLDAASLHLLRPHLLSLKLESHKGTRIVEVEVKDMVRSHIETGPETSRNSVSSQDVERPFLPDLRVEKTKTSTIQEEKQTVVEARQVTYSENKPAYGDAQTQINQAAVAKRTSLTNINISETKTVKQIDATNKRTTSTIFGNDIPALGHVEQPGLSSTNIYQTSSQQTYQSKNIDVTPVINDGQVTPDELVDIGAQPIDKRKEESINTRTVNEGQISPEYHEGLAELLPLGSVLSMGMKASYGLNVTASDMFWAALDTGITAATFGAGAAFSTIAKAAAKNAANASIKLTGKSAIKSGVKTSKQVIDKITPEFQEGLSSKEAKAIMKDDQYLGDKSSINKTHEIDKIANNVENEIPVRTKDGTRTKFDAIENDDASITGLKPCAEISKDGYIFTTDELGRIKSAQGTLELNKGVRDIAAQQKVRKLGLPGDDAGHLIGTRFNGPGSIMNLTPQNANLNRGAWKSMENKWEDFLKQGKTVDVSIQPFYVDSAIRPDIYKVAFTVDGKPYIRFIKNMGTTS